MKNLIAFTLAVGSFIAGQGQNWCPPGARWINDFGPTPWGEVGYVETQYAGEIIYMDSLCEELVVTEHIYSYQTNSAFIGIPFSIYTTSTLDIVRGWTGTAFDTLFNYAAVPGDHWEFQETSAGSGIHISVLDTGHRAVDGVLLRFLAVEASMEDLVNISDTIFERIGTIQLFLDFSNSGYFLIDGGYARLRCYSDNEINVTRVEGACEIALGVNDIEQDPSIHVWPNPGTDHCAVSGLSGSGPTRITLHDAFGRVLQTSNSTGTNVELNTSELRAGVYFVVVENGAGRQTENWIKQ